MARSRRGLPQGSWDLDDIKTMQAGTVLGGDGGLLFRGADSDKGLGGMSGWALIGLRLANC
jgi:hypothetical protein